MLSLLFAAPLAAANPEWHYARQVANSSITTSSAALTGTAVHNCSWSWSNWLDKSGDAHYTNFTNLTSTYTYYNITASLTTECDGVTRIVGDLTTVATGTNTTFTSTTTNYTEPSPTCTPSPEDCSELNGYFGTYPCPRPTSGVSKLCGQCSIWGGTVDLLYFPLTATTSHNLCPNSTVSPGSATICPLGPTTATANATNPYDYQPCYYTTGNATSSTNSGPYVVSGGQTFYQNRAYISLQTAYASDSCGIVGERHMGTILEVKSEDVYSVGGYHHEFQDAGYQFNFQDLQAVPSYAYYLDCNAGGPASCYYEGTRYRYGTDFLNGHSDIDLGDSGVGGTNNNWIFQEAYTPILLLPTQIRSLDPAWASCSLNLGGLYDPPKALTQAPEAPGPTAPSDPDDGTTTAQPGNGPTTSGPTPTAEPITLPPTTTDDNQPTDTPDDPSDGGDDDTPAPTTPNNPQPTGGDDGDDSPPAPTTPNNPDPTGEDDNVGDEGQNGGGNNGSDDGSDDSPAPVTTTAQNIGGVIASIIGVTSANNGAGQAAPTPDQGGSSGNDDDPADPAPAPVTFTADDGTAQTVSAIEGTSDVFVVGTQTLSAGGSAIEVNSVTVSAGSSGQIVAGSQTLVADSGAQTPAAVVDSDGSTLEISTVSTGSSAVFVVDDTTLSAGGSAATVNGVTLTAGPSGVVDVNAVAAATGADGAAISVSTIIAGSSGVYVADGTTLSVGGDEQLVNGATLSAAPTGVVDVGDSESSSSSESGSPSDVPSAPGSGSSPQQTGNTAAAMGTCTWLSSAAACVFAAVVALL